MDFLTLLAHRASATRVVSAASKGSTVETILELFAVLGFPCFDGQAVLLLDLVPVPLGYDIKAAEGYDAEVRCEIVDVASLQPLFALCDHRILGPESILCKSANINSYKCPEEIV